MQPGESINLTAVDINRLEERFERELRDSLVPHQEKEEQLHEWQIAYNGEPKTRKKTFPFPDACNTVIPLIGIAVDSIVARVVNTIFAPRPFWTINPLVRGLYEHAKQAEKFLDWSQRTEFDLYGEVRKWCIEVVKFGWSYLKVYWTIDRQVAFEYDDRDGTFNRNDEIFSKGIVQHVLLSDIINQFGIEDDDQAEWIAQRFRLSDTQLRWREYEGVYQNVDDVIKDKEDISDRQYHMTIEGGPTSEEKQTSRQALNQFYEIWAEIHVPKANIPSIPATLTFHLPRRRLVRAIHNPYFGARPYIKGKFIELEGRREGFGIARRLWQLQESITTIHRQGVDNATIANTRFFLGRRGAIRPGTQIWAGRVLTSPDPDRDLKAIATGEVYPSNRALEISELAFAERASGISDPQLGRESNVLGSRATATGTLAIIQEGNRRFDLNIRDMREALSKVGRMLLQLNQQFRPTGFAYAVQGPEGQLTEETLNFPRQFVRNRLGVNLTASTSTINRDVERQGLIALLTVLDRYYERIVTYGGVAGNPQVPVPMRTTAVKAAEGARLLIERITERFDVQDIDVVVPSLAEEIENARTAEGNGAAPVAGTEAVGGMAGLPSIPPGLPPGSTGTAGQ